MTMARIIQLFAFVGLVSVPNDGATTGKRTVLTTLQHRGKSNYSYRVHEGRDVAGGEYPFVIVLVVFKEEMFGRQCTGSMIKDTWGITAAHCSGRFHVMKYYVAYDRFTESPLDSGHYVPVLEMFLHPSYRCLTINKGKKDLIVNNDICVFRSESVPKKPYAVLLPADYSTLVGLPVVYVGAGGTTWYFNYADKIRPLQVGEATIIACDEEMRKLSKFVICLAPKCSKKLQTPWYGDSGGPLIYDGKIIGVASYIIESKIMPRFGYVPVSPYIDWIHRVISASGA